MRTEAVLGLLCASCGANVVFEEPGTGGEGAGPIPSNGGGVQATGGGGEGTGGAPRGPVPGCEVLEWAGDPVVIEGFSHPARPQLGSFGDGDAGVVYLDRDDVEDVIVSQVVEGPFSAWPPTIGGLTDHDRSSSGFHNGLPFFDARSDGVWSITPGDALVATFGVPGVLARYGDGGQLLLEAPPANGAFQVQRADSGIVVRHMTDLGVDPKETVEVVTPTLDCYAMDAGLVGSSVLLALGTGNNCEAPPVGEIFRITGGGAVESFPLQLPFAARTLKLHPRSQGGAWVSAARYLEGPGEPLVWAQQLDSSGSPNGLSWTLDATETSASYEPNVSGWREGLALFAHTLDGPIILVTDGVRETRTAPFPVTPETSPFDGVKGIVAAPDGSSVLVAFPTLEGLHLLRADCKSP